MLSGTNSGPRARPAADPHDRVAVCAQTEPGGLPPCGAGASRPTPQTGVSSASTALSSTLTEPSAIVPLVSSAVADPHTALLRQSACGLKRKPLSPQHVTTTHMSRDFRHSGCDSEPRHSSSQICAVKFTKRKRVKARRERTTANQSTDMVVATGSVVRPRCPAPASCRVEELPVPHS